MTIGSMKGNNRLFTNTGDKSTFETSIANPFRKINQKYRMDDHNIKSERMNF